ncbi:hypothetical protein [Desulfobotulus sp.]|jgi:hypothetical protein|uniref:hypothetical protein n=1 Tax=Desulfobotulus sp. TaxID=1940337 RepID=UPI002A35928B|nr:hypothetical protein [Desulfobotulus sp.]MDY0161815.1 hypothetical protein [Desulfobotulus sp.]
MERILMFLMKEKKGFRLSLEPLKVMDYTCTFPTGQGSGVLKTGKNAKETLGKASEQAVKPKKPRSGKDAKPKVKPWTAGF